MSRLNDIRDRLKAASPGPWEAEKDEVFRPGVFGPTGTGYFGEGNIVNAAKYDNNQADVEFIAHSRQDMRLLVDALDFVLEARPIPYVIAQLDLIAQDLEAEGDTGMAQALSRLAVTLERLD